MTTPTKAPVKRHPKALALGVAIFAVLLLAPASSFAAPPPLLSQFCESGPGAGQCVSPLESPPILLPATFSSPTREQPHQRVQRLGSLRKGLGLGSPRRQKRTADLHRADWLPVRPRRRWRRSAQSPQWDRPRQLGQRLRRRPAELPRAEVRSRRKLPADVRRRCRPGSQPQRQPLHSPIHRRRR